MILRFVVAACLLQLTTGFAQTKAEFRTDALRTGANEFQFWTGYSPDSLTWIGKSQARRLYMAGAGWRRVILATDAVAWRFTVDVVPLMLVSQPTFVGSSSVFAGTPPVFVGCAGPNITAETVTNTANENLGPCARAGRRTTYGFGLEPVGFDLNFRRRHRFQPVAGINGGFAKFPRDVPISNSNSFNFTFSLRGGMQIFMSQSHSVTVGYRYHHISNANTGNPFNPGIDSNFIYFGYSFYR